MALNLMLQGTMSNAGKSLLAAALCRIFKQDGYRVAPFKSQNMALNSFITAAGGEMGRAQVVQAEAAGLAPDVRMNPILLKPTTDVGSQVIVNGQVVGNMRAMEYYRRKREFLPAVLDAYAGLDREYDVLVIEGAGSPAEINLKQDDFVNMGLAKLVDAPVLLIGDIDRGGVFAQLYGTIALLESDERARVKGTIINKFRGDRAILEPGLRQLEALLSWLRQSGLEAAICKEAARGTPVFGVCGGYQMLGRSVSDPDGVEAAGLTQIRGLGLLDMDTVFHGEKVQRQTAGTFSGVQGLLSGLNGLGYEGYEIHMGQSASAMPPLAGSGSVYGSYIHGVFDAPGVADAILRALCARRGIDASALGSFDAQAYKERQYDLLADAVRQGLDMDYVYRVLHRKA